MALHFDATPGKGAKPRVIFVAVDAKANAIGAFHTRKELEDKHGEIPVFGPVDVKSGVHRQYVEMARQGNPAVFRRANGRAEPHSGPLKASLGARAPNLRRIKRNLTGGRG